MFWILLPFLLCSSSSMSRIKIQKLEDAIISDKKVSDTKVSVTPLEEDYGLYQFNGLTSGKLRF
ncbi:unnamed protein product [Lepidochelys olivacea]